MEPERTRFQLGKENWSHCDQCTATLCGLEHNHPLCPRCRVAALPRRGACIRWGCAEQPLRRQNTNYTDPTSNWTYACEPCFEEIEAYWAEMWAEYYAGVL